MHTAVIALFLFVLATLYAITEIEAEGKYGWAEKFPTWYRVKGGWIVTLYVKVNNKPLTGYHAALFPIPLMIFAYPMVASGHFTLNGLLLAIATYCAWAPLWDFCWFILNPHYGARNFRRGQTGWWFGNEPWLFGRIPLSYLMGWGSALALATVAGGLSGSWWGGLDSGWFHGLVLQLEQLGYYLLLGTLLAVFGTPRFHRYYSRMRAPGTDQRHLAGISHIDPLTGARIKPYANYPAGL